MVLDRDPAAPLVLREARGTVHRGDEQVPLTLTEFRLLCELAAAPGPGASAAQALLERVWEHGFFGDERIVDVHVRRLRTKVERDPSAPAAGGHRPRAGLPAGSAVRRAARAARGLRPRGLRARIVLGFAAGTLLVSVVLVVTTFLLARSYLLDQREASLTRQAFADANVLDSRLATAGTEVGDVLGELVPSGRRRTSSCAAATPGTPPASTSARGTCRRTCGSSSQGGAAATAAVETADGPAADGRRAAARPPASSSTRLAPLTELQQVLRTLAAVLGAGALAATAAGAAFGVWASRRAVQPLEQVAGAATRIAGGELTTRLPGHRRPRPGRASSASFNSMVDALAARIERDARFVGDVSHELRSPLTTLVTSVEVLGARRDELSPRGQQALAHGRGRAGPVPPHARRPAAAGPLDGGAAPGRGRAGVAVRRSCGEVLAATGRPAELLAGAGRADTTVRGRQAQPGAGRQQPARQRRPARRAGRRAVRVERRDGRRRRDRRRRRARASPLEDRERIFERFARGPRRRPAVPARARASGWRSSPRPRPGTAGPPGAPTAPTAAPGSASRSRRCRP